jgi:hypothetical protein
MGILGVVLALPPPSIASLLFGSIIFVHFYERPLKKICVVGHILVLNSTALVIYIHLNEVFEIKLQAQPGIRLSENIFIDKQFYKVPLLQNRIPDSHYAD